ncbi:MAG: hypothetical protein WD648_03555 [Planctomycetaceae bacterium]
MEWHIPKRRDQAFSHKGDRALVDAASADFNVPLPENDGGVCIADGMDADEDIREGRVKSFSSPEDLIKSLKHPW